MSDLGIIVALTGHDATSPTITPEQCAIHSKYPCPKAPLKTTPFKYFDQLTYTFTSNPTPGTTTDMVSVHHNLGYVPMSVAYYNQPNNVYGPTGYQNFPWSYSDAGYIYAMATCDNSDFKIQFVRNSDGGGFFDSLDFTGLQFEIKYYLFVENG